jgi:predicted HTH domain antitoxin
MQTIAPKVLKTNSAVTTKAMLLTHAYASGGLSLGQLARALDMSYSDIAKLLNLLNIPVLDYDLADELDTLESDFLQH